MSVTPESLAAGATPARPAVTDREPTVDATTDVTRVEWRRHVVLGAAIWAPMFVWWLALLPGGMSNDSISIWGYVRGAQWEAHHPVPYTAFVWLMSGSGVSPAPVTLMQSILVAAALAFLAHTVSLWTGAGRWPWIAAIALATLPLAGPFSVILWKDVPDTAAVVCLAAVLVTAAVTARDLAMRRGWWIALAVFSAATALFRWNGVGTVLVAAVFATVALPRGRRSRAAVVMAVASLASFGVLLLLPHVAAIKPLPTDDKIAEQLTDLSNFARDTPAAFTANDRAVLERVAPFHVWQRVGYTCSSVGPFTYYLIVPRQAEPAIDANSAELTRVWRNLLQRRPGEFLQMRACRAALAWSFVNPHGRTIPTLQVRIAHNTAGLRQQGPPALRDGMTSFARMSTAHPLVQSLLWRPMPWLLALLAAGLLAVRRRGWRLLVAALAAPIGVEISYAVAPAAQDARYTYAAVLIAQLVVVGYVAGWLRDRFHPALVAADDRDGPPEPAAEL